MSGEAVGFPLGAVAVAGGAAVLGAGVVVAAVVVPGSLAARAIRSFVDGRVEAAEREAERERARMEDWRRGVEAQGRRQGEEANRIEALMEAGRRLAMSEMAGPSAVKQEDASGVQGLIAPRETLREAEGVVAALGEIGALLDGLGKVLVGGSESPLPLLHERRRNFEERLGRGERVFGDEVRTFRALVIATLEGFRESEERRAKHRAQLLARVDKIFGDALRVSELAADAGLHGEVEPVLNELRLMPGTDRLSASRLDAVETHLEGARQRAVAAVEELAARRVLEEAVIRHLGEFGYEVLEGFAAGTLEEPRRARLQVPGGEQVWITLQASGALAFRLVHEERGAGSSVIGHFLPEFKRQEGRWCADLKRLFSCLTGDGFPYEIRFERAVPEGGVQVVYVEVAEGWERGEARRAPGRRGPAKAQQRRADE
jgi:hypothetical protein